MDRRLPCVYILASRKRGTLYVGVTSDLITRIWQHKTRVTKCFTNQYHAHVFVWFELHGTMESAVLREKAIKNWKREWKIRLVEDGNPQWVDLYPSLV
ncbi:GIY-YIG nuclease family protein [Dyella monticola]|uniref:GIY-YIG nuclease family protein n=1 Tax=Dyella monticola TaxID=1927958 RepID=A0A370WRW6_9GAMM|nr:GIY-YIG nuclease family protein [Dyella monticola]RDS78864.1 GIY-YIG nuclease family protein [Dyella monticola]